MNLMIVIAILFTHSPTEKESTSKEIAVIDSLYEKYRLFRYNNRDSARYYLNEVLRLSKESKYLKGEANALKGLGFLSHSNAEALQYYIRALEIRQAIKDSIGIGISLFDIGTVYRRLDTVKMMEYFRRSFNLRKKINDYGGMAQGLIEFGRIQENKNDFARALAKFKESLHYRLLEGEINGIAYAHVNMAEVNYFLKNYDTALYYSNLAQSEFRQANDKGGLQWTIWLKASCYFAWGLIDKALAELKNAETSDGGLTLRNVEMMATLYELKADFKQALAYQKKGTQMKEEESKAANDKAALEVAADYEYRLKQDAARQLEEQQQLKKKRQDNLQFLFIAMALIGSFVFIALLRKRLSERAMDIMTFVGFMFLFEFLIVLVEPSLLTLSGNKPILILLGNTLIALIVAPLHHLTEKYFKRAIARSN